MTSEVGHEVMVALASVIKTRRLGLELSQERLASLAGRHRSFIGLIEAGKRGLSVAALVDIAQALDASASELLSQAEVSAADVARS